MAGRFFFALVLLLTPLLSAAADAGLRVVAVVPPLAAADGPDYHLDGPPQEVGCCLLVSRPQTVADATVHVPVAVVRVVHAEGGRAVARLERRIPRGEAPFLVEATPMVGDEVAPLPKTAQIELPGDILFAFDRADLRPEATAVLTPLATALTGNGPPIEVDGHTDSLGSDAYNQALSQCRAAAVARYLTAHGVSTTRLRVHGHGEREPVADNTTASGRAHNRRVEIRLPLATASR